MLSGVWNLVMGHSGGRQHTQDRLQGRGLGALGGWGGGGGLGEYRYADNNRREKGT